MELFEMRSSNAHGYQDGFSLVELLITILIFSAITGGILVVFDNSGRLARAQTQLAVMQQSQRVGQTELVRYAKAAGLGGLPITRLTFLNNGNLIDGDNDGVPDPIDTPDYDFAGVFPEHGIAMAIHNNIPGTLTILEVVDASEADCTAATDTNCVVPGTDVLLVRGVLSTPLYYLWPPIDTSTLIGDNALDNDDITLRGKIRVSGDHTQDYPQDLEPLVEILQAAKSRTTVSERAEAFILRDTTNPNAYVVAEFDHANINLSDIELEKCTGLGVAVNDDANPNCLTFPIKLDELTAPGDAYAELASGSILHGTADPGGSYTLGSVRFPTQIGSIGLLEEFRFFVRINWQILPPPLPPRLSPTLARARFLPGANVLLDGSLVDVAENVIDLQLAVGVDTDNFGDIPDYGQVEDLGTNADEVLFNASGDNTAPLTYAVPPDARLVWFNPEIQYHFLRINTVVESAELERGHTAAEMTAIEDYNRGTPFNITGGLETNPIDYNSDDRRSFRRRWLQTVVELRNLL